MVYGNSSRPLLMNNPNTDPFLIPMLHYIHTSPAHDLVPNQKIPLNQPVQIISTVSAKVEPERSLNQLARLIYRRQMRCKSRGEIQMACQRAKTNPQAQHCPGKLLACWQTCCWKFPLHVRLLKLRIVRPDLRKQRCSIWQSPLGGKF